MKVISYITPEMNSMTEELRSNMLQYEKRLQEAGIIIREKRILTATIILYIFEKSYDEALCSCWAYYPKTGIEDFISCTSNCKSEKNKDVFAEICTDRLLRDHNWHNREVECAIEVRKKSMMYSNQ